MRKDLPPTIFPVWSCAPFSGAQKGVSLSGGLSHMIADGAYTAVSRKKASRAYDGSMLSKVQWRNV